MKLLQLNVTANWGSTGRIAEGIGNAAIKRGWESYIAYGRYSNPSQSRLIKAGTKKDVYSHYFKSRFFNKEGLGSKRATKRLIGRIREINPDIIHLHNIHDHWLNYPVLFQYLQTISCPVVWTFHDCWAFTGGCMHFIDKDCRRWQSGCHDCPLGKGKYRNHHGNLKFKSEYIKSLGDRMNIISVSQWLDSQVGQSILGELSHSYIYNGIDIEKFQPSDYEEIDRKLEIKDKKIILGVSNVWPESKGLKDYIQLRSLLDEKYVIILVGLPNSHIQGLPKGIIGLSRTNNIEELRMLYSRADIVMSLSKAETFGLTLVEGMACGTPSVGYATTAINEIITPDTGIKVAAGDFRALAEAVRTIGEDSPFAESACRNSATDRFNQDIQFNKYVDLYEGLIHK